MNVSFGEGNDFKKQTKIYLNVARIPFLPPRPTLLGHLPNQRAPSVSSCVAARGDDPVTGASLPTCRDPSRRALRTRGEWRRGGEGRCDSGQRLQISLSFISEHRDRRGPDAPSAAVCQLTDVAGSPSIIGGSPPPRISTHLRMETMGLIWRR